MYYVVKVDGLYLGSDGLMHESSRDAMRLEYAPEHKPRIVKVTTQADRTADSMRGLASDIDGDNGGGPS